MTYEAIEVVEIGQAEALIELGPFTEHEEMLEKFDTGVAAYVEFE